VQSAENPPGVLYGSSVRVCVVLGAVACDHGAGPLLYKEYDMRQVITSAIAIALLSSPVAAHPMPAAAAQPPSCTVAHQPAGIVRTVYADYPAIAKLDHVTGTSVIRVDLTESGDVRASSIAVSSGSAVLDRAAIEAAKTLAYAPETHDCHAISGSYAVQVEFND
jgi:TonB family protein